MGKFDSIRTHCVYAHRATRHNAASRVNDLHRTASQGDCLLRQCSPIPIQAVQIMLYCCADRLRADSALCIDATKHVRRDTDGNSGYACMRFGIQVPRTKW